MKQYDIRVTNTTKVVLTLIITPLFIVPIIVFEALYGPKLADWLLLTEICVLLALALAATLVMIKKVTPAGILTVYDDGFSVDFPQKNFFTPAPFEIKICQINNFYLEGTNGLYYLNFTTSTKPSGFNIEARSKKEEDIGSFLELAEMISKMIEESNNLQGGLMSATEAEGSAGGVITSVTMYEKPWAKILVGVSFLVFLGVFVMAIFKPGTDDVPWWRMGALIAFGLPFAYKVYYHNYRKKK